jgi:hypothetical protein
VSRRPWTGRPWTCASWQQLARLAGTLSEPALAERFGRTVPAIHAALWKLRGCRRVTPVPPVPPMDPKAAAAAARALAAEIAAARAERATAPLYKSGELLW